jgi:hypothetical protein
MRIILIVLAMIVLGEMYTDTDEYNGKRKVVKALELVNKRS